MAGRGALHPKHGRASYIFNATIAGIDEADAILIVGSNPRREAAILNARIRKRWGKGGLAVAVIGEHADLTYPYDYLGAGADTLAEFANGKLGFGETFAKAQKPLLIVGRGALAREDGAAVLAAALQIASQSGLIKDGWNGFCVLHDTASMVGALDIGFVPGEGGADADAMRSGTVDVLFNLGVDEVEIIPGPFTVYIGTHGDHGANRADVILPGAAYTEKSATFVNTEGRVQMGNRAIFPVGDAKEDWAIIRALSDVLGARLPFDTLTQLRAALYGDAPHLAQLDGIASGNGDQLLQADIGATRTGGPAFASPVQGFLSDEPDRAGIPRHG